MDPSVGPNAMPGPVLPRADAASPLLRLGGNVLDLQAGTLHDATGSPVTMRPQAWAVLELLARHAGSVVTKEQLLQTVWAGLVVTDSSIAQAVKDLRLALGAEGHSVVKSVARRGYMLLAADATETVESTDPGARPLALPLPPSPLFGRDAELRQLRQLLEQHRLVTVLGAGGIGKTVFALATAHRHVEEELGQVAWVDLAPITDPALLPVTLARALGLPISQGNDPLQGLLAALRPVTAWLVLDNAEHLVDAVARLVTAALGASEGLRLLVTSQAPLHLERERLFRLSALRVPESDEAFASAAQAPAVAMFLDRAKAADHRFSLTPENMAPVVRLCRRLDGLPLAIRLAAGRVHLLGLSGLEAHLHDRFQWLASQTRDAPTRQQTLAAALAWSYGLLAASEQKLFRHLGVFVGGFTIDLALAVGRGVDAGDESVLAELEGLLERSLVSVEPTEPPRYRLLESQREQALRELEREGELDTARHRHAHAMAEALFAAAEAFWSMPDVPWMARWAPELDNIRAALKWSERHDAPLCASLVGSVAGLFRLLDLGHELARQAEAIDADSIASLDAGAAARFWLVRAYLEASRSGRRTFECAEQAERFARAARDRRCLYLALCQKGATILLAVDEVDALLAEIAELESADWPPRVRCQRLRAEFTVHNVRGQWPQALRAAESGFALALEGGTTLLKSVFGNWTIVALLGLDDVEGALQRSRAVRPHILPGPASMVIPYVGTCARISFKKSDFAATRRQLAQMFELSRRVEWMSFEAFGDLYLALALAEGRTTSAARLLGYAAVASQRAWGVARSNRTRDAAHAVLARSMDPADLARFCADGATLEPESVCSLVLDRGQAA